MREHDLGYQISIIIDPQVEDGYYGNFFFQYKPLFVGIYHKSEQREKKLKALGEIQKITSIKLDIREYLSNMIYMDAIRAFSRIVSDVGTVEHGTGPLYNSLNPSVIYSDDNEIMLFQNHVYNPDINPKPVKKKEDGPKVRNNPKVTDVSGVWF